ncbi:serine/threonine protein kinase [Neobacillus cucumis]|uniref:serine/threonine-protein kinase n=1 Tax=Neobacillus cucumis TaxID=1740721 RepID=UPI0018DEF0C8|nr:serine/threonine-protein kinase [Neobacillus cucumis]MBI0578615.1 serine/threonine protein kinase [Neobacillus cucumis]
MISKTEVEGLLNGWTVISEFPNSGQKKVFLVEDNNSERKIVKIVKFGNERVKREVEIVTENKIPSVPNVFEFDEFQATNGEKYNYIVEEFIDGMTLKQKLQNEKLNIREGVKLLETLLNISVVLEEIKIVHRDIKPDNIICSNDGEFYLIDFGIARQLDKLSLTFTQAAVGPHTPGYGAPELFQYSKKDIDIRSDLFSVGVVLFEALTGQHPFITGEEMDLNEVWYRTRTVMPKDYLIEGDKSKQLLSFIQTLMQKHVTRRPPDARKALEWFLTLIPTLELGEE